MCGFVLALFRRGQGEEMLESDRAGLGVTQTVRFGCEPGELGRERRLAGHVDTSIRPDVSLVSAVWISTTRCALPSGLPSKYDRVM